MSTITSTLLLKDLCKLLEKICNIKIKEQKAKELSNYIRKFKENVKKANLNLKDNGSFFPVMRLLLPRLDRERGPYGIKEATLAKIYVNILGLSKDGIQAQKLINFRVPQYSGQNAGDFADVAFWVLQGRASRGGEINIDDLNQHFDKIADLNAANDSRGIDIELTALLQKTSPMEQKWIIRMLLKNINIGIGHNRILNLWHPDGLELFDVCNNLVKVCERLTDASQRLHEIEVSIFEPFRPMLANRCNILHVEKCLKTHDYLYVETKYDGERFQLHFCNGEFKYFSRGAFEYTNTFGSNQSQGILTPLLAPQLDSKCNELILDGEMMGWDPKNKLFKTKGITFDVKKLKPGDKYVPFYCIYDILLYNNQVLTNRPYIERVELLDKLITPKIGVVQLTERHKVQTSLEITTHLNEAIDKHLEGIIIKEPNSIYKPNARTAGWFKIKPEYTEGLMDHLDLIIMGGYYGEGKHRGTISHFLLGLRDEEKFLSFCKVGSGYSHSELAELAAKLLPHWKNLKHGQAPASNLIWNYEKPDVWIQDNHSIILEVKATEITRSKDFAAGFTLRFPRVQQIRYEKKIEECMTLEQFYQLFQEAQGKLYSRHVPSGVEGEAVPKKRRKKNIKSHPVPSYFRLNVTDPSMQGQRLREKEFCVISDTKEHSKNVIEKQIIENGGKISQNPGTNTFCIIVGDITFRVKTLIKSNKYDMVKIDWLLRFLNTPDESIEEPDWTPFDMIHAVDKTKKQINLFYDQYGDNYRIPATIGSINQCFDHMDSISLTQNEMSELDIEIFFGNSPFSIFRLCTAIIEEKNNSEMDWISNDFRFYGGLISKELTEQVTHVILSSSDKITHWKNINDNRLKKMFIVSSDWVFECCRLKTRLEEHDFPMKSYKDEKVPMEID